MYNYNFHTHTFRCGHAKFCKDEDYIINYISNNFKTIGFSDHMPFGKMCLPAERERMDLSQLNSYIKNIKKLNRKYKNIDILCGLECEYSKELEKHLIFLKEKCDYLILGQHFVDKIEPINNPDYPLYYAHTICKAISTGLFDYIAHPDIFFKYRDTITAKNKKKYEENCIKATKLICSKASNLNIPLEIDLSFLYNTKIMKDDTYPYPHINFFQIAKNYHLNYIIGINAHNPKDILKFNNSLEKVKKMFGNNINILNNYNPIDYRKKYKNLDKMYNRFKGKPKNYEYYIIKSILNSNKNKCNPNFIIDRLYYLKKYSKNLVLEDVLILKKEIDTINNSIIKLDEKQSFIKRKKEFIKFVKKRDKIRDKSFKKIINNIFKLSQNSKKKDLIKKIKDYYS